MVVGNWWNVSPPYVLDGEETTHYDLFIYFFNVCREQHLTKVDLLRASIWH